MMLQYCCTIEHTLTYKGISEVATPLLAAIFEMTGKHFKALRKTSQQQQGTAKSQGHQLV